MMSGDLIREMSDRAARKASREKKTPYVPYDDEEIDTYGKGRGMPFPFIGSYEPKGWERVESLFCDSSGFGGENEPALTIGQLKVKLREYQEKTETYGFAVTEAGQFQVYLGVFKKL